MAQFFISPLLLAQYSWRTICLAFCVIIFFRKWRNPKIEPPKPDGVQTSSTKSNELTEALQKLQRLEELQLKTLKQQQQDAKDRDDFKRWWKNEQKKKFRREFDVSALDKKGKSVPGRSLAKSSGTTTLEPSQLAQPLFAMSEVEMARPASVAASPEPEGTVEPPTQMEQIAPENEMEPEASSSTLTRFLRHVTRGSRMSMSQVDGFDDDDEDWVPPTEPDESDLDSELFTDDSSTCTEDEADQRIHLKSKYRHDKEPIL